jgi:cytochrome P450
MTFALYRLAKHPEYVEPLREEIASLSSLDPVSGNSKNDMPLLDSFLKETARLHPLTTGKRTIIWDSFLSTPYGSYRLLYQKH